MTDWKHYIPHNKGTGASIRLEKDVIALSKDVAAIIGSQRTLSLCITKT